MDTNNTSRSHCRCPLPPSMQPPPPHLVRSRSGAPTAMSLPETRAPSQRFAVVFRSKSTSKSRTNSSSHDGNGDVDNSKGDVSSVMLKKRQQSNSSGLVVPRKTRSAPPSPSAWALSPGRSSSLAGPVATEVSSGFNAPRASNKKSESKINGGGGNGGAVSKVLKYFKQKRNVSPLQEEEIHKLRILHSSLLQWRFANARARAAEDDAKRNAEEKLCRVWLGISKVRSSAMEKIVEMQRLRHGIRLYEIISPQVHMLQEYPAKLERKHGEGLGRLSRKLVALSHLLPLESAKADDTVSIAGAMNMAMEALANINSTNLNLLLQAEELYHLTTELVSTLEGQRQCFQELDKFIPVFITLLAKESSLRAHVIEATMESTRVHFSPTVVT
ncbi:QWRF motif-containing protein 7 [Rhodamnia argentea]|uniref:QWRF motif-containing protein 7 n=1 Tax=Rhodamnia argentea TaxID=178133 RepID=A0A8B8P6C4_9MYRT|nr:QWRF motif-containing protein 7 [Rhodamnia argentea]